MNEKGNFEGGPLAFERAIQLEPNAPAHIAIGIRRRRLTSKV